MRPTRSRPLLFPRLGRLAVGAVVALAATAVTGLAAPPADAAAVAPTVTQTGPLVDAGRVTAPAPLDDVLMDQGTGVPLPDGRTLWLFADTADVYSAPYVFVTSSVAFAESTATTKLRFVVDGAGQPAEFLGRTAAEKVKGSDGSYTAVWPMGATTLPDGRIIVAYSKFHVNLAIGDFTFQAAGLYEYRYPGYDKLAPPVTATRIADDMWKPADGEISSPVYANGYVYFTTCEGFTCFSVRTPTSGLTDRTAYRWWTGTTWSAARADRSPMVFGGNLPSTHPSVQWMPTLGTFVMADTSMGAPSGTGLVWVADTPQGPWSTPVEIPLPGCEKGCYLPNIHAATSASSVRIAYAMSGDQGPTMRAVDVPLRTSASSRVTSYSGPIALADTKTGVGAPVTPLAAGARLPVTLTRFDQPSNTDRLSVTVRVSGAAKPGRLAVRRSGAEEVIATVDYGVGATDPRLLRIPVGANGRITVGNDGGAPVDVRLELLAWWSPLAGRTLTTVTPTVVADTATATGLPAGPLVSATPTRVVVAMKGQETSTNAVQLRVTARSAGGAGTLRIRSWGSTVTVEPSLTIAAGATTTNIVWVKVDTGGAAEVRVDGGRADVKIEVLGVAR
jgi:hypothetical protein